MEHADPLVKDSTIRSHAAEYRQKAEDILKASPEWIAGEATERSAEYLTIAAMFDRLL